MIPFLAGIETEYGLSVEEGKAEDLVDDAMALVRAYPGERFVGWDYRFESPRADLRGFRLDRLSFDPDDARYDAGKSRGSDQDIRSDRILPNGARLYNDHGHPEYSTPECRTLSELVRHDLAGEIAVRRAATAFESATGKNVRIYRNNTDFHGASYGTHESYLVPREFGFETLYRAVVPILIARQVLCGAGKVGYESGAQCAFQLTQRADFMAEPASAETLYRRSLFNTRDEPHADPARWTRLHVICGDANMTPGAIRRKAGLVYLALALMAADEVPEWKIPHPVAAFQAVSKDETGEFRIELDRRSWTKAFEVLESYLGAAEQVFGLRRGAFPEGTIEAELSELIPECRELMADFRECPDRFRSRVDWAAKRWLLNQVREEESWEWDHPALQSYDLEYHNVDPEDGLYFALADAGEVEERPSLEELAPLLEEAPEGSRARARGLAVSKFQPQLANAAWRRLTFERDGETEEVELPPDLVYPSNLSETDSVEGFIEMLRSLK